MQGLGMLGWWGADVTRPDAGCMDDQWVTDDLVQPPEIIMLKTYFKSRTDKGMTDNKDLEISQIIVTLSEGW